MRLSRRHFSVKTTAILWLAGAAPIAHPANPLSVPPYSPSGSEPVPCQKIQRCGATVTYQGCDWPGAAANPESGARQFLAAFGPGLGLDQAHLRTAEVKMGLTGAHARFEQVYENRRVVGAEVVVTSDPDGRIRKVLSSYFPVEKVWGSKTPTLSAEEAEAVGRAAIGRSAGALPPLRLPTRSELVWFPIAGTGMVLLAWELMIHGDTPFLGDYLTRVDAHSGTVLQQEDWLVNGK